MLTPVRIPPHLVWPYADAIWKTQFVNPSIRQMIDPSVAPSLWVNGERVGHAVRDIHEVARLRGGAFTWHDDHFIFSLPAGLDPTTPDACVIVGVPLRKVRPPAVDPTDSTPLFIVGPQRSGTTALGWALHQGSRFKLPQHLVNHTHTAEGYLLRQMLGAFTHEATLRMEVDEAAGSETPVGVDRSGNRFQGFATGIFADTGHSAVILREIARAAEAAIGFAARSPGCWTEKSPGWEALMTVPLAHALFPRATTFFLSREPGSGVLSQLRLRNLRFDRIPESTRELGFLGTAIAEWAVTHHYWRRFIFPHLPKGRATVIPFATLRAQPEVAIGHLASVCGLTVFETHQTLASLTSAPVAIHRQAEDEELKTLHRLIRRLAWPEAVHWGHAEPAPIEVDTHTLTPIFNHLMRAMRVLLQDLGVPTSYAERVAAAFAANSDRASFAEMPDPSSTLAAEKELPRTRPAPLLAALLEIAAGYEQRTAEAVPAPILAGLGSNIRTRAERPLATAGPSASSPMTPPDAAPVAPGAANRGDPNSAAAALALTDPPAAEATAAASVEALPSESIPCSSNEVVIHCPASPVAPRILLQRYTGRVLQPSSGDRRATFASGSFCDPSSGVSFPWTARFVKRRGRRMLLDCSFNGHPGMIDCTCRDRTLAGLLTMSGRIDVIEGRVGVGGTISFDRWFLRESEVRSHIASEVSPSARAGGAPIPVMSSST